LSQVLPDPALRVFYLDKHNDEYVDINGDATLPQQPGRDQKAVPVYTSDSDNPIAIIYTDSAVTGYRHQEFLSTTVKACVLGLENARLRERDEAQLDENRKLLGRIAVAEQSTRRQIGLDIHDRAQAMLQAVRLRLANSMGEVLDEQALSHMQAALTGIQDSLEILREIAKGVHPHVLKCGLRAAILDFAEHYPSLRIVVDAPDRHFTPTVEFNAYLVACEAVTNAARHADASLVTVRFYIEERQLPKARTSVKEILCVQIRDDGKGGAQEHPDGGLAGLRDRMKALAGDLQIFSSNGQGTEILARIPCA
jgi:signal transduction histidine kinase